MDLLKKMFPLSFPAKKTGTDALITGILLYVALIVAYFLIGSVLGYLLGRIVAWLLGLLGTLVGMYAAGGIVMSVLRYCGIIK